MYNDQPLDKNSEKQSVVELPSHIDQTVFRQFYSFFYPHETISEKVWKKLGVLQPKIPLEIACNLMNYMVIAHDAFEHNIQLHNDFLQFIEKIMGPEGSLFVLSQHFFAKERALFFEMWRAIEQNFPPEFWVAHWSEQLWQASLFIIQAKDQGPLAARKGINRLPFSFMQRDWKRYTPRELCAAHNFLYSVDYGLKNGYASHGIELFLEHFLQGTFTKK